MKSESQQGHEASQSSSVSTVLEEVNKELLSLSLQWLPSIGVLIGDSIKLRLLSGRFAHVDSEDFDATSFDSRVSFRDDEAFAEVVSIVRDAFSRGDIPAVLGMLFEAAWPSWGAPRRMEVSGTTALARFLWTIWLATQAREEALRNHHAAFADEDLSQGWVMIHSVHPGLRERVEQFQKDIDNIERPVSSKEETEADKLAKTHWLDEIIKDLYDAAEKFRQDNFAPAPTPPVADAVPAKPEMVEMSTQTEAEAVTQSMDDDDFTHEEMAVGTVNVFKRHDQVGTEEKKRESLRDGFL